MRMFKSSFSTCRIVLVLAMLCALGILTAGVAAQDQEPIRIGFANALTGSAALQGNESLQACILAAEEFNAAGGLNGRMVEIISCDSKCSATDAVSCTKRLIYQNNVVAMIGHGCSGPTLATYSILEEAGIPIHTDSCSDINITLKAGVGGNYWVFRTKNSEPVKLRYFSKYIVEAGGPKVAVLAVTGAWGQGSVAAIESNLPLSGGYVVSVDYYEEGETEFLPVLTKIKNMDVDALFVAARMITGVALMKQYRELEMEVPIFSVGEMVTQGFIDQAGADVAAGVVACISWFEGDPADAAFIDAYEARWGQRPIKPSAEGYVAAKNILEAIKLSGAATPDAIRDGLLRLERDSVIGPVEFDEHHQAWPEVVFVWNTPEGKVELLASYLAEKWDGYWAEMEEQYGG